jgi:PilZ domain
LAVLIQNAFDYALEERIVLGVLVATQNEFRRYPRFACPKGTILAWQTAHQRVVSAVDNVGLGGLYIVTPKPPAPGTFIQLLLDVPAGEVRATAVVQRSEPKEGMAVKFVGMQQEYRSRFFRWLKRLSS